MKRQIIPFLISLSMTIATPTVVFAQTASPATPGAKGNRMEQKQENQISNQGRG